MNICVIGGGRNFGKDFCDRAQRDGHNVRILSHRDYNNNDIRHACANFNDYDQLINAFNQVTNDLTHIDVFLYNSTTVDKLGKIYYKSTSNVNYRAHIDQLNVHVIVPHFLCVEALKKMNSNSKIIFMTSGMGNFDQYKRSGMTDVAAYAGSKAYQNFLMAAFADHNDKNAIVASMSPHFDYYNVENYKPIFEVCYKKILTLTSDDNGKILTMDDIKNIV
jgi:NAD(P)-dependent dehydrogenase (short-subunit alcohol dehydrogenase family)